MMKAVAAQINKAMKQIRQPLFALVARGGSKVLQLKGFADETLQEVELFQQVGFNSHIPEGARVVVIPLHGKTSRSIVVATTGGAVVVNVDEGETVVYDQFGHSLLLKEDGTHITAGDLFIDDGDLHVTKGQVFDKKGSMQEMRDIYNKHKHGNTPTPTETM
ncbi:phage baseplate assembly protein [Acinetobacter baumannii]|uniref:phage baseplate assembly protein domain-containing protein n=1 Tax=Acinetobacter calcoaceticus/baumannii complex TaxID=909768 RepID=UPI000F83B593|nr:MULTISPECIES: phage baseplate assembly protein [Acinetobacter calcoaceticus/baumannii complex]EHU1483098.1 phage baseplate assembly protein [Acinetobacter baumannii]EHU2703293.1 phage baseplate assembly protein [Acinetobacter baumannii]MDC4605363.1 phage baseplate assembly protein [Acinetobacter baumannii]MDD7976960.1 phage baseplate assembly protein [Acinetobacter baumannii]MDH2630401.1 phage baseplate assembly protein [Acinetobacter baumannii]